MGPDGSGNTLLAIEVDRENTSKDLTALDIPLPILRPEWCASPYPDPSRSQQHPISTPHLPNLLTKTSLVIVETKGFTDVDVPHKMQRLAQWVSDLNALQSEVVYDFAFVDEAGFQSYRPKSFSEILIGFKEYKSATV